MATMREVALAAARAEREARQQTAPMTAEERIAADERWARGHLDIVETKLREWFPDEAWRIRAILRQSGYIVIFPTSEQELPWEKRAYMGVYADAYGAHIHLATYSKTQSSWAIGAEIDNLALLGRALETRGLFA